jgi:lincosamide nucleotidyltransferase A/C/D/E
MEEGTLRIRRMDKDKLINHFDGNRSAAYAAIALFAIGLFIFITNSNILLASPERAYRTLRIIMKAGTDTAWILAAMLGTKYYPTKRNKILIWTLIMYTLGDIAVMFSYPVGAVLYCIGHLFMMWTILETTYIHRWQIITLIACTVGAIAMLAYFVRDPKLIIIASIYAAIVTATMALSLSNRFFWLAGIVFALSDITGLLRISLSNNKYTYFVTTTIYFAAFLMLCISVYSTNRKEVVTIYDLFRMLSDSKSKKVSFWVCGKWALGLIKGDKHFSYDHIELAYDVDHVDEFLAWIKHARFEGKHRYAGGARDYYSEKYGELQVFPCLFETDGSAVLTTMNGTQLQLDEGYFEDVRVLGKTIPCIAPGGPELIRDVL